jgi:transcriptional regulator with XRE-family HTH domain
MARTKKSDENLGKTFGLGVKRVRENQGMKQETLAMEVGYGDRSQIAKIETGKTVPSLDKALRLAETLQVPVEAFMKIGQADHIDSLESFRPETWLSHFFHGFTYESPMLQHVLC